MFLPHVTRLNGLKSVFLLSKTFTCWICPCRNSKLTNTLSFFKKRRLDANKMMFSNTNKPEAMTEKRRTCMRLLLWLWNCIYETRFCNNKLLGWTHNVGGILLATRRYDIITIVRSATGSQCRIKCWLKKNCFVKILQCSAYLAIWESNRLLLCHTVH